MFFSLLLAGISVNRRHYRIIIQGNSIEIIDIVLPPLYFSLAILAIPVMYQTAILFSRFPLVWYYY